MVVKMKVFSIHIVYTVNKIKLTKTQKLELIN